MELGGEDLRKAMGSLGPERPLKERVKAVVVLRRLCTGDNREALWADAEVRKAVKAVVEPEEGAEEPPPAGILSAMLGLLLSITASSFNSAMVLRDAELRGAVLAASHKLQPELVQVNASLVLVNLALAAPPILAKDELRDMYEKLSYAIAPGRMPRVRCAVLGALWTTAAESPDPLALWRRPAIREEVLASLGADEPEEVRAGALGFLWAIAAGGSDLQEKLWANDVARQALVEGVAVDEPLAVRANALLALKALAAVPENCEAMWEHATLSQAIFESANEDNEVQVREPALELLARLSMASNVLDPLMDAGVYDVFRSARDDERLASHIRRLSGLRCAYLREDEDEEAATEEQEEVQQERSAQDQDQGPQGEN